MADNLLVVRGLKQYYPVKGGLGKEPSYVKAVDNVDFEVRRGEVFGIVGESGCGKSTLGKSICKLIEPTDGSIVLDGEEIAKYTPKQMRPIRKKVQMVFQDPYASLNPRMSVRDIVAEPLIIHGLTKTREETDQKVVELLRRVGLDVSIQSQVLNLMNQLKRDMNLTYIFVAHDLSVVEHISDRVGVMYLGNFVEEGDKYSLYQNPLHPYTQALLSAVPIPDPKAKKDRIILEGNIPSALNPPSGCKFHTRCPKCMERCKTEAPQKYQVDDDHFVYCHLYDTEEAKKNAKAAENAVIHQ